MKLTELDVRPMFSISDEHQQGIYRSLNFITEKYTEDSVVSFVWFFLYLKNTNKKQRKEKKLTKRVLKQQQNQTMFKLVIHKWNKQQKYILTW